MCPSSQRICLIWKSLEGDRIDTRYLLPLGPADADGETRLDRSAGIKLSEVDGKLFVDDVTFSGPADQFGMYYDWEIVKIDVAADRPRQKIFYIPALLLVALIAFLIGRMGRAFRGMELFRSISVAKIE